MWLDYSMLARPAVSAIARSRAVGNSNINRSIRHFLGFHVVVQEGLGVVILTTDVCSVNHLDYLASLLFGLCNVQT